MSYDDITVSIQQGGGRLNQGYLVRISEQFLAQGLYKDKQSTLGTKQIEHYSVSLNLFSAASHSHTCHESSVIKMSLPCMLSGTYILHGKYLALINSHLKLQFCA